MKGWLSNDTGWKITSLVLATLIWFAIKFGIQTDFHAADMVQGIPMEMTFSHLPITLLIKDGEFYSTHAVDYHGGEQYPHLERDTAQPDLISDIIRPHAGR